MNTTRCEIRVPTFRRSHWLRRALSSLQAQTHENWIALVFDDSPQREGAAVVAACADRRISYLPNRSHAGAAANLDRAFQTHALAGGDYACVLEDDNWLLPTFLAENVRALEQAEVPVLLRNQQIWTQVGESFQPRQLTTRGAWFRTGTYVPSAVHARLFFNEGISNGGLFWRTSAISSFAVGPTVTNTGLQEYCRTLALREPLVFAAEPLAVWAEVDPREVTRGTHSNRWFARGVQQIRVELLKRYGRSILDQALQVASEHNAHTQFSRALAELPPLLRLRHGVVVWPLALRGIVRYHALPNPLRAYFSGRP